MINQQSQPKTQNNLPDHQHTGKDATKVNFSDIDKKKFWVRHTLEGTTPATAGNYGIFFIVPMICTVTGFTEAHQVKGTDGSAVTLQLEALTGTTVSGSGINLLTAGLSLKATINTVQNGVLISPAPLSLSIGNRLGLVLTGTPTAVANLTVVVELTF